MERLREILGRTWVRRSVIGVYAAALSTVVAVYIGISLLDVQTSAYFRGSATLEKGEPNPVRGVVRDTPTGQFRRDVEVVFSLLSPKHTPKSASDERLRAAVREHGTELGTARPGADGVIEVALSVPAGVDTGAHELVVRARGSEFEPFVATSRVRISESGETSVDWPDRTSRISNEDRREKLESGPVEEQGGEVAVDLIPYDGEVPRGLPGRLFLRTYDAETGEPIPCTVHFEKVEGMGRWGQGTDDPSSVETDALGLAKLSLHPVGGQKWQLRATESVAPNSEDTPRTGTATLLVHTVASQISIELADPIVGDSRLVRGEAANLFRTGRLYVDAYHGRRWLVAGGAEIRNRSARFEMSLPEPVAQRWLYRVQVSRGLYGAGNSWDVRYLVDRAALDDAGTRELVGRVAEFVAEHRPDDTYFGRVADDDLYESAAGGSDRKDVWSRAYLTAIPRSFSKKGTLFNTEQSDRSALESWKDDVQSDLMIVIGVGLLGGFAVLLYVVLAGVRRNREHEERLRDVDDELAAESLEDEEVDVSTSPGMSAKMQAGSLAVVGFATFVMFALGLMLLLSYL